MIFGQKTTFLDFAFCISIVFNFSCGQFSNSRAPEGMLMQNVGVTNKEQRALWYIMVFSSTVVNWFVCFHNCKMYHLALW